MDLTYEQICSESHPGGLLSKRLLIVLIISLLIHFIILLSLGFIDLPAMRHGLYRMAPISMILEQAGERQVQHDSALVSPRHEAAINQQALPKPRDRDLEILKRPIWPLKAPDITIAPVTRQQSERARLTARELLESSQQYIEKQVQEKYPTGESGWSAVKKSRSVMFGGIADSSLQPENYISEQRKIIRRTVKQATTFPDCRTAYAGAGLLAIPLLIADAFRKYGCRW